MADFRKCLMWNILKINIFLPVFVFQYSNKSLPKYHVYQMPTRYLIIFCIYKNTKRLTELILT